MISDKVPEIYINTGNLISYKEFNRKAMQLPTEEVFESVSGTLNTWIKQYNEAVSDDTNILYCINQEHAIKIDKEDRANLKLTVKVFLERFDCSDLKSAVNEAINQLDVNLIDSLILALPEFSTDKPAIEHIKPLWSVLEALIQEGKVVTIGISDLDTSQLAELYQWAQVKPSINQVNLESCCVMPPEMTTFAKDNDILLLTHNDPKVILPSDMVKEMLTAVTSSVDSWKARWIVRCSVVVKCRGIIQSKGYIMHCVNEKGIPNGPS